MKINELNEAGAPHLPPGARGTHLPAVVKPTPPSTIFTAPEPKVNAKPNPTVKPVADITDVKPKDVPNKPAVDLKTQNAAAAEKGPRGRGAAGLATGALVGLGAASLMSPNKQNPTANTQPATTTTTTPTNVVTPSPVKPKPNLNYKGSEGSQSLMALNPDKIKNVNQIRAGDSIDLGGGNMYKIQKGDTLDKIAQRMTRQSGQARAELDKPDSVLPRELEKPPEPAPVVNNPEPAPVVNTPLPEPREAGIAAANDLPYTPPAPEPEPTQAATTTLPEPREAGIAAANDQTSPPPVKGTPENPYDKGPEVKSTTSGETWKDREGNAVRTRSDAEIGDTDRFGRVTPGSFDKNRENGEKNLQAVKDFGNKVKGWFKESTEELNRIRTLSGMSKLTEAPVAQPAPTTATNASSLRTMQNNAGIQTGTTGPAAKPAVTPAPSTAMNASSLRTAQNNAGMQKGTTGPAVASAGGGRGSINPTMPTTQAATTTPAPSAGGGRGFVNPTMPKTQAATTKPAQPAGPAVGSQAQTASGANELAKRGIMGGQPAPSQAANPATPAAGVAFNQGNLGTKAPAANPLRGNFSTVGPSTTNQAQGLAGKDPTQPANPMAGVGYKKDVAFNQGNPAPTQAATTSTAGSGSAQVTPQQAPAQSAMNQASANFPTTSTAGSGVANNTTMAPQQAPAQSAMNIASNTQAATTSGSPLSGIKSGLAAPLGRDGKPMQEVPYDADMEEFNRDKADMNGKGVQPNQGGPETQATRDFEESIMRESTMELNLLKKFSGLSEITESDVTVHKGDYGNKYEPEVVRDQYGHKIGKVNKGAEASKDAPKRGRGRPTKGDKDEHGNDTKFDTSGLQGMLGGKPKGEVGKKSVKHSLKDWIEAVSDNMINEAEDITMEDTHVMRAKDGNSASWYGKKHMGGGGQYQQHRDDTAKALKGLRASGQKLAVGDTAKVGDQTLTRFGRGKDSAENRAFDPQIEEGEEEKKKENTPQSPISKEFKQVFRMNHNRRSVEEGAKPDFLYVDKDKNKKESFKKAVADKKKNPFAKNVKETKDLPGDQDNLDVAPPKGKLTKADFEALRKKKKVSEARVMEESEYTYEAIGKTLAHENPTLAVNSDEFANEVYHEMIQMGMTPKSAHNKLNHDPDFLGDVASAYEHYVKHNKIDEESDPAAGLSKRDISIHTGAGRGIGELPGGRGLPDPARVNPNTPAPAARTASPGWGKDDYKPLVPDTSKGPFKTAVSDPEGVKEAGSFIRNLAGSRRAFEGKNMKDVQLESWEQDLNSLLNENLTISTTIDDQGHDSVNVSATEGNAHEIIELLRNAGLGGLGGAKQEHGPEVNNYGLPMSGDEHQGPEAQLIAVGDPHARDSMGDEGGDDMMALIKKMTGIEVGGEEGHEEQGSHDYEQEEGGEEHGHEEHSEHDSEESEEVDEANDGNLANNAEPYDEITQGDVVAGRLGNDEQGGKEEVDEGHETCNECGGSMYEGHTCGSEPLEEFANSADDTADQDLEYMMKTISGGLNGQKRDQSTGPIIKIVTAEGTLMKDSTDLLSDFRKLSGI